MLAGCLGSRFVNDKVEVENQLAAFTSAHPETHVVVLRFAPIVGPTSDNPVTRWLRTRLVPTLLGFDPLWQVVHEDDAADALHAALFAEAPSLLPGVEALAGDGVRTGASGRNWSSYGGDVRLPGDLPDWRRDILCDPQTSGGLLIAVSPDKAARVLELVRARGFDRAAVVGRLTDGPPQVRVLG